MLVPKVTLQGDIGTTRNFVIKGKFVRFRAQVPRPISREFERRVRNMTKEDGSKLFKTTEIIVADPKIPMKEKLIVNANKSVNKPTQHVDGNKDTEWKQRKFLT